MKSLLPRSLSSQIAIVMTAALLIASAVNFALLAAERSRAGLIEFSGPAITRFVDQTGALVAAPPPLGQRPIIPGRPQGPGRYSLAAENLVDVRGLQRSSRLEQRLKRAFTDASVDVSAIRASTRTITRVYRRPGQSPDGSFGRPPGLRDSRTGPPSDDQRRPRSAREIVLAAQLPDGRWFNTTIITPLPPNDEIFRLGASTFILFACVLAAALWIAGRLSKPLDDLARATTRVGAAAEPEEVEVRGPSDIQQTLRAFNTMSRRVSQLLGEKDVMLGALGHDLRTPLASLRIRIETMEPEAERLKAIKTIEEAAMLLEDILDLARLGRSTEPVQVMDISILVQDIVEDYTDTCANVSLASLVRAPTACRPLLFSRLLRNLIDNALTYGGVARVGVSVVNGQSVIAVEDDGPGMSEASLATATHPFVRGDASRHRGSAGSGGAGLGLAIADAIARAHGGELTLSNRQPHGLQAAVNLPAAAAPTLT